MELFSKIRAVADALADKASSVKTAGIDTLQAMLEEASSAFAGLEEVGYRVADIELAVGLPPSATVYFFKQGQASDEAFAALAANFNSRRTASTLIALVRQADQWAGALRWGDRTCRMVAVELGLRPAVRLIYSVPGEAGGVMPLERQLTDLPSTPEAGSEPGSA
jgi:hypothetical protein